jgi:hypothetical protein
MACNTRSDRGRRAASVWLTARKTRARQVVDSDEPQSSFLVSKLRAAKTKTRFEQVPFRTTLL